MILTGRSKTSKLSTVALKEVNASYHCCDVTNKNAVDTLINEVLATYGKLNGIIHAAGVLKDSFLIHKTQEESMAVLSPKIDGAKYIDEATKDIDLDFMLYCSSISGVLGNVGQADYASANIWLNDFASYRNELVQKGKRKGHTISINWPLWKDAGMQIDAESEKALERNWGFQPLPSDQGIIAFEKLLKSNLSQVLVTYGKGDKIASKLVGNPQEKAKSVETLVINPSVLSAKVEKVLLEMVSSVLKLEMSALDPEKDFGDYGLDSILLTRLANVLNEYYNIDLLPTSFFNYPTIAELTLFLSETYVDELSQVHKPETASSVHTETRPEEAKISFDISKRKKQFSRKGIVTQSQSSASVASKVVSNEPIAIIGMSCRFPGSPDPDRFWEHLKDNKDLISEVPSDRWIGRNCMATHRLKKGRQNLNGADLLMISTNLIRYIQDFSIGGRTYGSPTTSYSGSYLSCSGRCWNTLSKVKRNKYGCIHWSLWYRLFINGS